MDQNIQAVLISESFENRRVWKTLIRGTDAVGRVSLREKLLPC